MWGGVCSLGGLLLGVCSWRVCSWRVCSFGGGGYPGWSPLPSVLRIMLFRNSAFLCTCHRCYKQLQLELWDFDWYEITMAQRLGLTCTDSSDRVLLLLFLNVMERRSLLVVYVFNFYQTLRVVPHGTKGTGPEFVTRPVYLRSQLRNNMNTISTLVLLIHFISCSLYTVRRYHTSPGAPDLWTRLG